MCCSDHLMTLQNFISKPQLLSYKNKKVQKWSHWFKYNIECAYVMHGCWVRT